jgi:uncharacterized protein
LTNACNQKTNRDPVTAYDEATVSAALEGLMKKKIVARSMVGRVPKYEELFIRTHNMVPKEAVLLCMLLLRGPQTVGELRARTSRMAAFDNIEAMHVSMGNLVEWGMIQQLPRMPGHKESRYGHLLSGTPAASAEATTSLQPPSVPAGPADADRLQAMEKEIAELRQTITSLKQDLEAFKRLFD